MKITKSKLKQIIKEELSSHLQEQETSEVWGSSTKEPEFQEILSATTSKNARAPGVRYGYTEAAFFKIKVVKMVLTNWWEDMPKDYVFKFTFSNGQVGITPRRDLTPRELNRNAQVDFVDTYFGEIGHNNWDRMKILDIVQIDIVAPTASEPDAEPKFEDLVGLHADQLGLLVDGPWGASVKTLAAAFYNADGEVLNLFLTFMKVLSEESQYDIKEWQDEWRNSQGLSGGEVKAAQQKLLQGMLETMKETPGAFQETKWEPGGTPSWASSAG